MKNERRKKILVVDDDEKIRSFFKITLSDRGFDVTTTENGNSALEYCQKIDFNVILMDYEMPGMTGLQVITQMQKLNIDIPVIMMTGHESMDRTIEAMSIGVKDFIVKPFNISSMLTTIDEHSDVNDVSTAEVKELPDTIAPEYRMIGSSPQIMKVYKSIGKISPSKNQNTVLITGETGTGKELVARQIHIWGKNQNQPFIGVNLNALPDSLVESELFGHTKGAFTNAADSRMGKLEFSQNGTILLDEIGDISINIQIKLLRVLQEREYYPIGSNSVKSVSSRIIATTNVDLYEKIDDRLFREDLFYRLSTFWIKIPPLRERIEDIPLLADYFIKKYSEPDSNRSSVKISKRALDYLKRYHWPGNVRELENVMKSAISTNRKHTLDVKDFDFRELGRNKRMNGLNADGDKIKLENLNLQEARRVQSDKFEKSYINNLLEQFNGKVSMAAKKAEISRQNFYKLMRKHNITISDD